MMAIPNSDGPVSAFPGVSDTSAYYSTGAAGNPSALPSENSPVLESGVVVSVPGQSSQVQPDVATVYVGDTAAASFGPTPPDGDPLTGLVADFLNSTGAGAGHVAGPGNPNSGQARP